MDYTALKTRVANEAGLSLTTDGTMIGTWVNAAYQHISGLFNWPWLFKTSTLQTVADITTGTVSINAASTSGTFSSAPSVSVANDYMIQFQGSDNWYFISSHTAASTSFSISVPYTGTSNLSGATYTVRKVFYSLPSDLDRIIDLRQSITKDKLEYIDPRTFDRLIPDVTETGSPRYYSLLGLDSSKYWRIGYYPTPNAVINIQLRYYQKITELSASSDTPLIPDKWHNGIVFGALALYGHSYIDDARIKEAALRFESVTNEMVANSNHVPDQLVVIQPWDTRPGRPYVGPVRFPATYGGYGY